MFDSNTPYTIHHTLYHTKTLLVTDTVVQVTEQVHTTYIPYTIHHTLKFYMNIILPETSKPGKMVLPRTKVAKDVHKSCILSLVGEDPEVPMTQKVTDGRVVA